MQEDFLHYIWKHKAFKTECLITTNGESITIVKLGEHNHNSGPDFFNAQLRVASQLWAGNVEIHLKSSDWYLHNHEKDKAYDNVILHVVWEHDTEIFRKDNSVIPTLELKHFVDINLLSNYKKLTVSKSWINCEANIAEVDDFLFNNWLERLYIERLEQKSETIQQLLKISNNDWEAVCFKMLAKNFGLKVNGESFLSLANSFDYTLVRKLQDDVFNLEALLFGQANLLNVNVEDVYVLDLKKRFQFIQQKFKLSSDGVLPIRFFRLRPSNFPTIRLSQLAMLYNKEKHLFSELIVLTSKEDYYKLFDIETSAFWKSHYTFSKTSKPVKKTLSKAFVDLMIINTIIPLKFSYAKSLGKSVDDELFKIIRKIKLENNSVVSKFIDLKLVDKNALSSQALLQLKQHYCDKSKCLQCAVGNSLIVKN